jgi:hypothetical protein
MFFFFFRNAWHKERILITKIFLFISQTVEKLERGDLDPLGLWDVKILQQVAMLIHYEPYKAVKAIVSKETSHSLYGRCRTVIDSFEEGKHYILMLILKHLIS